MVQQCVENIMNIQEVYMYIHIHVTSVTAVPSLIPLNSHTQCFTAALYGKTVPNLGQLRLIILCFPCFFVVVLLLYCCFTSTVNI